MKKSKESKKGLLGKLKKEQKVEAGKTLIQELLEEVYLERAKVYQVNFFRGVFFGFGSVLGGTILIALVVWLLAQVGALVPFLSDFIQDILDALSSRGK